MKSETRNIAKHNFDHIYNCDDPRPYFTTLRPLDYRIHEGAIPVLDRCTRMLARLRGLSRITMVDVCTGYGVNAALLRHRVELDELYDLYDESARSPAIAQERLIEKDRRFFEARRIRNTPVHRVIGIDRAPRAVRYGEDVGLLDYGAAENLEDRQPSEELRKRLANTTLVTVVGGLGYLSPNTFEHILGNVRSQRPPWIVAFPLLTVSLQPFRHMFARFGLRTEVWEYDTFPQRRFVDQDEESRIKGRLRKQGVPVPNGEEYLQARMICARPRAEVEAIPLREIIAKPRRTSVGQDNESVAALF